MHTPDASQPTATTPAAATGDWRRTIGGGLILVGLALGAYWPSLRGGFVWDDLVLVHKNPLATGEATLANIWGHTDFSLSAVVTWLEWLGFKDSAGGYRIINLALHGGSALLTWKLLQRIKIPGAWWGAAIFALHPMAVASVAWISELKNTLSLPFFLLSALWFLKGVSRDQASSCKTPAADSAAGQAEGKNRASRWCYVGSLVAFVLALLAKTSTVMLPALLLLLVWWQNRTITRRDIVRLLPHFGLALLFGGLTIYLQTHQAIRSQQVQTDNWWERGADAGIAVWFYLGQALAPIRLCAIYPDWTGSLPAAMRVAPVLLLTAGGYLTWRQRNTWGRPVLLGMGSFILAVFPALGFFDMYFMIFSRVSDHFAYIALLVVGAGVATGLALIPKDPLRRMIAGVILAGLFALTWQRAGVYATDENLWRDTVAKNPRAWNAYNNLACNLAERGELDQAIEHFITSLKLNPKNAPAQRNLGKALTLKGRFAEAEPHFRAALELRPDDIEALTAYAEGLAPAQRLTEAMNLLRRAIAIKPAISTRRQLVALLLATGNHAEAATELRAILAVQSDAHEDLNNLAWLLATSPEAKIRNGPEAVRLAQRACELTRHQQPMPLGTLAAAYAETGDFTNAVKTAQAAIERATATGDESFARMNQQLLRLYRAQRAFHMPAAR